MQEEVQEELQAMQEEVQGLLPKFETTIRENVEMHNQNETLAEKIQKLQDEMRDAEVKINDSTMELEEMRKRMQIQKDVIQSKDTENLNLSAEMEGIQKQNAELQEKYQNETAELKARIVILEETNTKQKARLKELEAKRERVVKAKAEDFRERCQTQALNIAKSICEILEVADKISKRSSLVDLLELAETTIREWTEEHVKLIETSDGIMERYPAYIKEMENEKNAYIKELENENNAYIKQLEDENNAFRELVDTMEDDAKEKSKRIKDLEAQVRGM